MVTSAASPTKIEDYEWKVYVAQTQSFALGDTVFYRPKSGHQPGRVGDLVSLAGEGRWTMQCENNQLKTVATRRLVPMFPRATPTVLVCKETVEFRHLALSQVHQGDSVLEVGCSTGMTSKILIRKTLRWVGIDNSSQMVDRCKDSVQQTPCRHCFTANVLREPKLVAETINNIQDTTIAFIDIGGNRKHEPVLQLVAWVIGSIHAKFIVVKNEELAEGLESTSIDFNIGIPEAICGGSLKQIHPLKAPMSTVPHLPRAICRYHNYHPQGCYRREECPFDHTHCHACKKKGHIGRDCKG